MTILGLLAPSFKCNEIFYLLFFHHLNCEYLLKNYNKFAKDWVGEKVLNYENTVLIMEGKNLVALELNSNQL